MRSRVRELSITPGIFPPGPLNTITDVEGVLVGQISLVKGESIRTGATAVIPHPSNVFQEKTPAGIVVGNGFGKFMGSTQIDELGEIETPIVLTNTLAVPRAADAIIDWTLKQRGNETVQSVNPVVGETNDGRLNDIRRRVLTADMIREAIEKASSGKVEEGNVGAGTGTTAFGWKAGIGTSSRKLPASFGGYTLGALVQTNFDGNLQIEGVPVGKLLNRYYLREALNSEQGEGSIIMVLATDAPLSDRNLVRLARRAFVGLARTGGAMSNGSGDYALAFSNAEAIRRTAKRRQAASLTLELPNEQISPLFAAAAEAVEEAILNSLFCAETMRGYKAYTAEAIPIEQVIKLLKR